MRRRNVNKRGYMQDFLVFGIILFVLAIIIVAGAKLSSSLNENYQNSTASSAGKEIMQKNAARFTVVWDYAFLTILALFIIAIFASFFLLQAHPAFFFVILVVFAVLLIPLAILSNVFEDFTSSESVAADAAGFDITNFLLEKWPLIFGVVGLGGMVVLFAKLRQ